MDWKLRPAGDFGLSPRERLASLRRELGFLGTATHWCWRQFVRLYLRCFHGLRVMGREHLPEPPFVMIANHASHLDTLTLASVLPLALIDRVHPIAAEDTFFTSFATSAFAAFAVNALPLRRRATKRADLATLRARLLEEELVFILFPEGTRSRDGSMASFKPGIGALVAGSEVPVVPCYLEGAFAALPPHRRWPRPTRLKLRIGPPLAFGDLANDRGGWAGVAARCETAVRALALDDRRI
ncbi:MAG TPA: lysophospholipid acyltransferase family protein [Stellaceae bacterium]|nr:lysophospholipid acyltransferase family protein [Stellaceae bacterium]